MKALTVQSSKSNFYSNILRISLGLVGLMYLFFALQAYFTTYELATLTVINGILGVFILAIVVFNPTFGANIQLVLNNNFMRIEEDLSFVRTAYWSSINKVTLTRFSIRIKYQSGAPERFRLPYVKTDEHTELRDWLQSISKENDIQFAEKAWWKPF